jgi:hypothetical protein
MARLPPRCNARLIIPNPDVGSQRLARLPLRLGRFHAVRLKALGGGKWKGRIQSDSKVGDGTDGAKRGGGGYRALCSSALCRLWRLFPECPEYRNQGRGDCIQGWDVQGVECGCTLQVQRGPKVQVQKHDVMRLTLECLAA